MGYLSRLQNSNEKINSSPNPWGSQNPDFDDFAVLLNGLGKRCRICQKVILNRHLTRIDDEYYCPNCEPEGV